MGNEKVWQADGNKAVLMQVEEDRAEEGKGEVGGAQATFFVILVGIYPEFWGKGVGAEAGEWE